LSVFLPVEDIVSSSGAGIMPAIGRPAKILRDFRVRLNRGLEARSTGKTCPSVYVFTPLISARDGCETFEIGARLLDN
jgi:hypothetical protein